MKPKHFFQLTIILLLVVIVNLNLFSQSLSPERVSKIKSATVRITIDGVNSVGTGFLIGADGTLLTCWHVVEPAFSVDKSTNTFNQRTIVATFSNGDKIQYSPPSNWFNREIANGKAFDFCPLVPINAPIGRIFIPLKIGNFNDIKEGEEVYTCGYPLGINQQFITKGMVSTKYIDTTNLLSDSLKNVKTPINLVLMDITLNRGNSGGAIVKIGTNIEDDEVIAIADFIINPIGRQADNLIAFLNSNAGGVFIGNVDSIKTLSNLTSVISSTSNGISGGVSINHWLTSLATIRR